MLKTRIVIIIALIVGFVSIHLVERDWYSTSSSSFLEELLFIGGLAFGVSLLVAGIFRLRLIRRVNQVSARALEILYFAKLQRFTGARFVSPVTDSDLPLPPLSSDIAARDLAARIREAAAIGSVADLDALAEQLSSAGAGPGTLGHRIASLAAAFDYDALLRLAASLDQHAQ
jgi:hypothetical protein